MTTPRQFPPQALQTFRERRMAAGKSLVDLQRETGIHRARLSQIELGILHTLPEHDLIETVLKHWEASK